MQIILIHLLLMFSEIDSNLELKFGGFIEELDLLLKFKYLLITDFGASESSFKRWFELNLFRLIRGLLLNVFTSGLQSFLFPPKVLLKLFWFLTLLIKSMIVEFCFEWLLKLTFYG